MAVLVCWEVAVRPLDDEAVCRAVEAALRHGGRPGIEISVLLTGDEAIAAVHGEWLNDPTPTDVISFDLGEDVGGPAGELIVGVECAERIAARRGGDVARELALYLVHGTLHLCGFDDHDDADRERMRSAERAVLTQLGYPDDPLPHDLD